MAGLTVLHPKRKNKTVYSNQKELFVIHFRIVTYEDEKKKPCAPQTGLETRATRYCLKQLGISPI